MRAFWSRALAAVTMLLALALVVGLLLWSRRSELDVAAPWQVSGVAATMWLLVLAATVVCVATAVTLTARAAALAIGDAASQAWLVLLLLTAGVLVWNVFYSAAFAMQAIGAVIPVLSWLFTSVPALVAGLLFVRRTRGERMAAAAGTGIVTVPLSGLSLYLLVPVDPWLPVDRWAALAESLSGIVVLCVVPLAVSVALAGSLGRQR